MNKEFYLGIAWQIIYTFDFSNELGLEYDVEINENMLIFSYKYRTHWNVDETSTFNDGNFMVSTSKLEKFSKEVELICRELEKVEILNLRG